MSETLTAPNYRISDDWGWGRTCLTCGRRLKEDEGPRCKREGCVLRYAVPNPAPTITNFGGNGAGESIT